VGAQESTWCLGLAVGCLARLAVAVWGGTGGRDGGRDGCRAGGGERGWVGVWESVVVEGVGTEKTSATCNQSKGSGVGAQVGTVVEGRVGDEVVTQVEVGDGVGIGAGDGSGVGVGVGSEMAGAGSQLAGRAGERMGRGRVCGRSLGQVGGGVRSEVGGGAGQTKGGVVQTSDFRQLGFEFEWWVVAAGRETESGRGWWTLSSATDQGRWWWVSGSATGWGQWWGASGWALGSKVSRFLCFQDKRGPWRWRPLWLVPCVGW